MEINVRNKKTWKQKGYYVGRPTVLGNPFPINEDFTREESLQRYSEWLIDAIQTRNPIIIAELHKMEHMLLENHKLDLVCWCAPKACHAELLKKVLLNKIHTNYWLIKEVCPTCNHWKYII
jgi:hypothetical protein